MKCRRRQGSLNATFLLLGVIAISTPIAHAEPIFFGPTPYLSAADSPFDLSGLGTTMFLEDFEDGELNTPGVFQPSTPPEFNGAVVGPSPFTDSVDADDGMIDGSGVGGHSFAATSLATLLTNPPRRLWFVGFHFDEEELGFLPTAVGFSWTDGPEMSSLFVASWDRDNVELPAFLLHDDDDVFRGPLGDDRFDGTTGDDRFFGIANPGGISRITIQSNNIGATRPFEMDHLQYGLFVPESRSLVLAASALAVLLIVSPRVRFSLSV